MNVWDLLNTKTAWNDVDESAKLGKLGVGLKGWLPNWAPDLGSIWVLIWVGEILFLTAKEIPNYQINKKQTTDFAQGTSYFVLKV